MDASFVWPHKDLLDVTQLSREEIEYLLEKAASLHEMHSRPIKKMPVMTGKNVVLFFSENSTRTRTSFDVASKRLSADTFSLTASGSSMEKGESLKDTTLTLQAMSPDIIVVRHPSSGAAQFLADRLHCSIVNAGDGWHAHPTQALLDAFTLRSLWGTDFAGKTLLIIGDAAHSRVFRSDVHLFTKLGVHVRLCSPRSLLPAGIDNWPVEVFTDLKDAVRDVDAIVSLRLQQERMKAGLLPDLREYASRYCLTLDHLKLAKPSAMAMHPGPILRGLDVSAELADSCKSFIFNQVASGVSIRMAVLSTLAARIDALRKGE
ncbi:MAG: aspartate carbamoyltransferase catalytic subunit [Desulfovibrionaceae bacterium]|nr:aspartate carbamoyltransferase catalytic subunit [Desulfovibrionaceae bacterium]